MEEIRVNDYVRTDMGICKITNIKGNDKEQKYFIDKCFSNYDLCFINLGMITKHSENIIDLIEVGDYVNGCKVVFDESMDKLAILRINGSNIRHTAIEYFADKNSNEKIESIVTHEQFNSIKYEVE